MIHKIIQLAKLSTYITEITHIWCCSFIAAGHFLDHLKKECINSVYTHNNTHVYKLKQPSEYEYCKKKTCGYMWVLSTLTLSK